GAVAVGLGAVQFAAKIKRAGRAGSAGIFPFRFRGQAVDLPITLAQAGTKMLGVVPGNTFDRKLGRILSLDPRLACAIGRKGAWIAAHYFLILCLGDFIDAQIKWLGNTDTMLNLLAIAPDFGSWRRIPVHLIDRALLTGKTWPGLAGV